MLVKQFKPNLNFVLLKRVHEIEASLLRAKDPDIPIPFDVEIIAIGPDVKPNLAIGDKIYASPHPYDSFYISFEDNDEDIFKVKESIMNRPGNDVVLPLKRKITFVTYLMMRESDIIATISPIVENEVITYVNTDGTGVTSNIPSNLHLT